MPAKTRKKKVDKREGTRAYRQPAAFARTQDVKAVVDQIVAETYEGLTVGVS